MYYSIDKTIGLTISLTMTLKEGAKGRISLVKRSEYQKGVGTPSIGLAYLPH